MLPAIVYADPPLNALRPRKKKRTDTQVMIQDALQENKPNFAERSLRYVDRKSDQLAEFIDYGADKIDLKLAGKKYTKRKNTSSITIKQLTVSSEGGKLRNSTAFGINLRLPNLEKRWQLRFSSYDENEEARNLQERRFRTRARENNPGAALLFFRKLGKVRTTFQPRLELKDPLAMSYLLRFESEAGSAPFRINPRLDLFADPLKGTGEYFHLNFSYTIAPRWELSLLNEEEYRERTNGLSVNHAIALDHSLSDDKGIGLSLTTNSVNLGAPYHLNSYSVSTAYAQEIAENRLRIVAASFLTFGKAEAFKGDVGCSFQVEVIF